MEDFDATQGADLLSLALGRQPGASDLDDYVDFEVYFDGTEEAEDSGQALAFLRAKLCEVFERLRTELDPYLWHRDRFILEPCLEEEPHLTGHLRIGDGMEDEWFVVHLLRRLSAERPDVSCRVVDADGEVILIEAALAAPRWASPANAESRCWLRGGQVHLLPRPQEGEPPQLSRREGLRRLRGGDGSVARGKMQRAIDGRLQGYPKRAFELSRHVVRAVLPERVARLLLAMPELIAVILDHLPTPPTRELQRLRRDLPEDQSAQYFDCESLREDEETFCVGIRFTRLQYARLVSLRCQVPQRFARKRWKLPKGGQTSEKAMQLGAMLCAGLEAAYLQGTRSATAVLRWREVPEVLPWASDPHFRHHLCPELLQSTSARRAYAQQDNLEEPFREALLRALQNPVLKAVRFEEHWRDRDDPEDWMQVSQEDLDRDMKVRQAEFDSFDQKRQKSSAASQGPSAEELQKEVAAMGSKISQLLQGSSSVDGVEADAPAASTRPGSDSGSDSESEDSAKQLDVLGMEEDAEEASDHEDGSDEEGGRMQDYFSELDDQLEGVLDGEAAEEETPDRLPLSSRHVKVHSTDGVELDMHAMEHVLASFCSENRLEPGPATLLLGELGLGGMTSTSSLDGLD
ncbi:unnamed protein product [Effrenium voratum]|uniref:Uncharacterized protein n=1 Tax=Effrenium voratum TaxID=2562239 RepID=A0AA36MRV6_9DINO|nr:unnamed protein product [Effrenium voratum]